MIFKNLKCWFCGAYSGEGPTIENITVLVKNSVIKQLYKKCLLVNCNDIVLRIEIHDANVMFNTKCSSGFNPNMDNSDENISDYYNSSDKSITAAMGLVLADSRGLWFEVFERDSLECWSTKRLTWDQIGEFLNEVPSENN
jgi:hypothetical protein